MGDTQADTEERRVEQELRTLSFRMREIQRLLNTRVEQENRRLEAEGIEPVPERSFEPGEAATRSEDV